MMKKKRVSKQEAAIPYKDDLEYLQDEMRWIEQRCVRILEEQAMHRRLEEGEEEGTEDWFIDDSPATRAVPASVRKERMRRSRRRERDLRRRIDGRHKVTIDFEPALDRLNRIWDLDDFERGVLLLCSAPCFSKRFEALYKHLDGSSYSGSPTVELAFAFHEMPFAERIRRRCAFAPGSRLVSNDLITVEQSNRLSNPKDLLDADLDLTSRTFDYLLGREGLSDEFQDFSSFEEPKASLDQVVLDPENKRRILSVVERHDRYLECRREWGFDRVIRYGRGVFMLFHGRPGTGKTMMAHAVAHHLGKRILNVDIPTFIESGETERFLPALFREARLQDAVLFFDECELIFGNRLYGNGLMTLLLTEIERFEGVAILATNLPQILDEALDRRILVKVLFPEPDRQARLEIWRRHLPPEAPVADDVDLEILADRYDMAGGYIKNAILMAVADAVHSDGEHPVITMGHMERAARDQLVRPRDGETDAVVPKARLNDVILDETLRDRVEELIDASRNRRTVLERWGIGAHLGYGKGLSALLHGPPGTGKTLCAEALAGELGRPLLTASLPALLSKWIGETEKNLAGLFQNARRLDAVLFLDEADSLLRSRGQAHANPHDDRAVNELLRLIERHDGVVLLATNLKDQLDSALIRRLTYVLSFTLPDASCRAAIWGRLLPASVPHTDPLDLEGLSKRFPLSGGHIKNAVFKAAFRAARKGTPLSQELLEVAAAEEMEAAGENGFKRSIGFGAA